MAIYHANITIGASPTQVSSTVSPKQLVIIQNRSGNSAIYIGGIDTTASSYGHSLAAGASVTFGPGTQGHPIDLNELYIAGTADDIVNILAIT